MLTGVVRGKSPNPSSKSWQSQVSIGNETGSLGENPLTRHQNLGEAKF